jgi:hypothetical protein
MALPDYENPVAARHEHMPKASLSAQARLVYPNQTPIGGANTRPGNVQPGNRQQAARLRCRLTEPTRQTVDDYLTAADKKPGDFLFAGHRSSKRSAAAIGTAAPSFLPRRRAADQI